MSDFDRIMKASFIIFALLAFSVKAQIKPIVQEDFSTNQRYWEVDDSISIANSSMIFTSNEDGDQSVINVYMDPQKDFILSADFVQRGGRQDGGFGLIWGVGENDYNMFAVSSTLDYAIHSGDPSRVKAWKKSSSIKPMGQRNHLKIEQQDGKLIFYINHVKVDEKKHFPLFGTAMGLLVLDQVQVVVDNFQFLQDQTIDLPENVLGAFKKENLGEAINSKVDELGPMISSDGKTLFFARQNVPENVGGVNDSEDVWTSRFENDRWTLAHNMGKAVNTAMADNLVAVSSDNNTMMFVEQNQLYMRHRTETGWSALEKLNLSFKNESAYFVANLTADGKAIIFSAKLTGNLFYDSKRDEGDLYVCLKGKDNQWSSPINLGKNINTSGNETSPFLSADGSILYFATDGRPGYGYQDIFFSKRTGNSWTDWSNPINLGPSVNTAGFEAYYTLPASNDFAYFVSNAENGNGDIYRIRLQDAAKSKPVTLVSGFILEKNTQKPLAAKIHFENLTTGNEVGEARSDPKTGAYQIILPQGFHYGIRASVMSYYSLHENLDLKESNSYNEIKKNLMMAPFELGETIKLNNVFFEAGLPALKSESYHELDRLVTILKENTGIHIELEGHTDNKGTANALLKLSQDRVDAVKNYLVGKGIEGNRITGTGYGSTRPVAPSDSEENSRLNRRVEFKITKV